MCAAVVETLIVLMRIETTSGGECLREEKDDKDAESGRPFK